MLWRRPTASGSALTSETISSLRFSEMILTSSSSCGIFASRSLLNFSVLAVTLLCVYSTEFLNSDLQNTAEAKGRGIAIAKA